MRFFFVISNTRMSIGMCKSVYNYFTTPQVITDELSSSLSYRTYFFFFDIWITLAKSVLTLPHLTTNLLVATPSFSVHHPWKLSVSMWVTSVSQARESIETASRVVELTQGRWGPGLGLARTHDCTFLQPSELLSGTEPTLLNEILIWREIP